MPSGSQNVGNMASMGDELDPDVKRVRLTGARFEHGRLPIDSLVELQRYQQVVRIAAEAEWRVEHPGEQIPSNFHDSVSLTIDHIDEGSADVFLAFEHHQEFIRYQVEAQAATDAIITAIYSDTDLPDLPVLPPDEDFQFRETVAHIGTTLKPEQSIEFYHDGPNSAPVSITVETRERAADRIFSIDDFLVSPEFSTATSSLEKLNESLVGHITALDADKQQFSLVLSDGRTIQGRYRDHPELLEDFRAVLNSTADGPLTRITGELQTKSGDAWRFWKTTSVEQVEFDNTVWGLRLSEFSALPSRWDGGEASQITASSLDAAQMLLRAIDREQTSGPGVFPTEEGGVLIEWANTGQVSSVEVLADGSFELFAIKRDDDKGQHSTTTDLTKAIEFVEAGNS